MTTTDIPFNIIFSYTYQYNNDKPVYIYAYRTDDTIHELYSSDGLCETYSITDLLLHCMFDLKTVISYKSPKDIFGELFPELLI